MKTVFDYPQLRCNIEPSETLLYELINCICHKNIISQVSFEPFIEEIIMAISKLTI
jgi:hypothetical protein